MRDASNGAKPDEVGSGLIRTDQPGFIVAGEDNIILSANAPAHAMFGYRDATLPGTSHC